MLDFFVELGEPIDMASKRTPGFRRVEPASEREATSSDLQKIVACEERLEEAVHVLVQAVATKPRKGKKPVVVHSLRVAFKLMSSGYDMDIVVAGLLHDLLEKSVLTPVQVLRRFGLDVALMVQATTNDLRIRGPIARYNDSLSRCAAYGEGALLVRAADLLDNCDRALTIGGLSRLVRLAEKLRLMLQVCREEDVDFAMLEELVRCQRRVNRRLSGLTVVERGRKS